MDKPEIFRRQLLNDHIYDSQDTTPFERRIPLDRVAYFYLGSELRVEASATVAAPKDKTNYGLYFLVVGSIEPRKNHKTILDAFEILWRDHVPANSVTVGSHSWMSESFLSRVTNHPLRGKR